MYIKLNYFIVILLKHKNCFDYNIIVDQLTILPTSSKISLETMTCCKKLFKRHITFFI